MESIRAIPAPTMKVTRAAIRFLLGAIVVHNSTTSAAAVAAPAQVMHSSAIGYQPAVHIPETIRWSGHIDVATLSMANPIETAAAQPSHPATGTNAHRAVVVSLECGSRDKVFSSSIDSVASLFDG